MSKNLTALVDGDIIVFRAGMAGQYIMKDVYSHKDLKTPVKSFRYVKEMKEWFKEIGKDEEDFIIEKREVLEPIEKVLHTTKMMMTSIKEKFTGSNPRVYLTGDGNFRNDIATEMPYKGNRWSMEKRAEAREAGKWLEWLEETEASHTPPTRPHWEKDIKKYLTKYWGAITIDGEEADDKLGYTQAGEALNHEGKLVDWGDDTIIVSVDKDLKMIPGYHQDLSDMDADPTFVNCEQADRNFYKQLLTGDRVDNIPGIKGIGPKKAEKALEESKTVADMYHVVVAMYLKHTDIAPEKLDEVLLERGRLLWIRRKEGEMWEPPK